MSEVRARLTALADSDELTARLLEAAAPVLSQGTRYWAHAERAKAAARVLRENARALRGIAGPDQLCVLGHGPGRRGEAA